MKKTGIYLFALTRLLFAVNSFASEMKPLSTIMPISYFKDPVTNYEGWHVLLLAKKVAGGGHMATIYYENILRSECNSVSNAIRHFCNQIHNDFDPNSIITRIKYNKDILFPTLASDSCEELCTTHTYILYIDPIYCTAVNKNCFWVHLDAFQASMKLIYKRLLLGNTTTPSIAIIKIGDHDLYCGETFIQKYAPLHNYGRFICKQFKGFIKTKLENNKTVSLKLTVLLKNFSIITIMSSVNLNKSAAKGYTVAELTPFDSDDENSIQTRYPQITSGQQTKASGTRGLPPSNQTITPSKTPFNSKTNQKSIPNNKSIITIQSALLFMGLFGLFYYYIKTYHPAFIFQK